MVKVQQDLIELPQFKINKRISRGRSNPPVPILHSLIRKARKAVDIRTKVEKQIAKKQKEEQLHELALHARTDRTGICPAERDISKQIVLDVQTASSTSVQYAQRLFNISAGFDSSLGNDEAYNVYDQPWNSSTTIASQIYKPTKDNFDDTEALINASKRFEQEYGFKEADRAELRERPVQFQCDEDPFGLSDFLKDVRHGSAGSSALSANRSSSSSFKRSNADDQQERTSEKRGKK
ncbi:unnamed protein product [Rotaria sordida]|uniref:Uncharacterized protein n=1 Tax=Rotaria sordida TaxID=392033 RepID=A0A819NU44_9BILA|nr:unnamed protein product [Rotaria sordida]